ncbi:MAG: site-specific integrase [Epibacterium sp.]|nr:site-specific integrase [Epibacterium sp.]NQX74329.1 tyrosine-type recombinase/integrase [Epibacterium sp.]
MQGDIPRELEHWVARWVRDRVSRLGYSEYDSVKCGRNVERAAARMGWKSVDDLTPSSCVEWLQGLAAEGKARGTMRNLMGAVRSLGDFLVEREVWDDNRLEHVRTPKVRAAHRGPGARAFTAEEVKRLIAVADRQERTDQRASKYGPLRSTLYRFLFETGLRYSEAMSVRVRDINERDRVLIVRADKSERADKVPLGPGTLEVLRRWIDWNELEDADPVFKKKVSHRTLTRDMERADIPRRDENGQGGQWHCFRKGIVTHHLRNGVDIKAVQKLARHATVQTTLNFYYQLKDHEARIAVDNGVL